MHCFPRMFLRCPQASSVDEFYTYGRREKKYGCVIYILQQLRAAMVNVGIFFMTYVLLNKNFEQPFYQLKYRSHN